MNTTATAPLTVAALVQNYVDYNAWANQRLIGFLKDKPTALLDAEVPSSLPTIRLTLTHILEVQHFWMSVIKGTHSQATPEWPSDVQGLMKTLVRNSEELANFARSLPKKNCNKAATLKRRGSKPINRGWNT